MALTECGLNTNSKNRELQPHGTKDFPCAAYESVHTSSPEDRIPWHWHEEFEIIYVRKGTMVLKTPKREEEVCEGQIVFINSNIPHECEAPDYYELESYVFSPVLTGNSESVFFTKYVSPILQCESLKSHIFRNEKKAEEIFTSAFEEIKYDTFGFEITVRNALSNLLFMLLKECRDRITAVEPPVDRDTERIEAMLAYLHQHYTEDISVKDVSKAVGIGERECFRCFKRTLNESPMQYLLRYRILQSAEELLSHPQSEITEIAMHNGFTSPSYFTQQFKKYYKKTPKQYRGNK